MGFYGILIPSTLSNLSIGVGLSIAVRLGSVLMEYEEHSIMSEKKMEYEGRTVVEFNSSSLLQLWCCFILF